MNDIRLGTYIFFIGACVASISSIYEITVLVSLGCFITGVGLGFINRGRKS
jgi:hypothetical protein